MIAFLLGLLKIIGITLLVVLILLLLVAGIVLFVPIRYGGTGRITENKKEASVKVTWLLKALYCSVDYTFPQKPVISVRVFGIDVMKLLEKRKAKETDAKKSEKAQETGNTDESETVQKTETAVKPQETREVRIEPDGKTETDDELQKQQTQTKKRIEAEGTVEKENGEAKTAVGEHRLTGETQSSREPETKEAQPTDEPELPKEKIPLKEKIQTIIDKVKNIIYNIKYYINILQEEDTKQLIISARQAIAKILKSIRPRKFKLRGEFGFATPDTTGKVYGLYSVVMPMPGKHVVLVPNFEEQVLRGEAALKGRITIFVIVVNLLRILFDKRLQPLITKLKNGGNKNGRK